jgi:hypothetical protein
VPVEVDEALASALTVHRDARCPSALELQRRLDAAWRSADGMADAHDVAAYVQEIAADELAGRRRHAAQAIAARVGAGATSGNRPRVLAGTQPRVAAERSLTAEGDETETANVVDAATAGRRQTASPRTWIAVLATLAAAVSLGAYALRAPAPSTSSAVEPLVPTSAPAPPVMPPSAPPARVPPPAPRLLAVHADAMLREVSIAGERILVGPPSMTVHVQLPAADAPVMVRVVAVDGRHAERLVQGDTSELSFELGVTPRRPPAARPSPAPPSDTRLLPYPPSTEQSP